MKNRAVVSALIMTLASVANPQLYAQGSNPTPQSPHQAVTYACPVYDLPLVPDLRSAIRRAFDGTLSSDPLQFPLNSFRTILSFDLPRFYILTGNWRGLATSRLEYQAVLDRHSPIDPVLRFHQALRERDAEAMREIASGEPLPQAEPFLAPVAELPELAGLYALLFAERDGLEALLDRLSGTAAARSASLAREPDHRQAMERDGDRERVSLAWLYFHLARISSQMPERSASAADYLIAAANLLSPSCQPRTIEYFRAIASGRPPCAGEDLAEDVNVYVCWLPEMILGEDGRV